MAKNDEKFLLVSLNEDKAKKLAQIISNDTCRKIIDFLAEKESSESEIAKQLKVPISTVHYNLQQLIKSKLVVVDEFHYSKKGKEINHYRLANKYIIIAPKETPRIRTALKKILPIGLITIVGATVIEFFNMIFSTSGNVLSVKSAMDMRMQQEAAILSAQAVPEITRTIATSSIWQHISIWFLIGGLSVIIFYLLFEIIRDRIGSKAIL